MVVVSERPPNQQKYRDASPSDSTSLILYPLFMFHLLLDVSFAAFYMLIRTQPTLNVSLNSESCNMILILIESTHRIFALSHHATHDLLSTRSSKKQGEGKEILELEARVTLKVTFFGLREVPHDEKIDL